MSYNIHLEADLGGPEPVIVGNLYWDYTSNGAPMWRAAGADLALFDQRPAAECAPVLAIAIGRMELDPESFRTLEPPSKWGSFDTLLPKLRELLEAFNAAPDAIVRVSR